MHQLESRKNFIKRCAFAIPSLVGIGVIVIGCNSDERDKKKDNNNASTDCSDLSGVSENDIKTRRNFNYVEASPDKSKTCDQCNLYILPKINTTCGGCMLFKGPVHAVGTCTYWAQKVEKTD